MTQLERQKPLIASAGKRRFIQVATPRARALHAFLRLNHVRCAPPDPSSTGMDIIELHGGTDVLALQTLLDGWA